MQKFYDGKVSLNQLEKEKLYGLRDTNIQRVKDGTDKLNEKGNSYKKFYKDFSQGSMAMHTTNQAQHNDDHDIDTALIYKKEDISDDPFEAKKLVEDALNSVAIKFKKKPKAKNNAVTVTYQENYHVDFAIYRSYTNLFGEEVYEHAGEFWTERNPTAITDWFIAQNKSLSPTGDNVTVKEGQLRRVVRLLKFWTKSRSGWSLPGGLVLSALAVNNYKPNDTRDDVSFYETLNSIRYSLITSKDVRNPVDNSLSLITDTEHTKQMEELEKRLNTWLEKLSPLFESDITETRASKEWGKFFKNSWWSTDIAKARVELSDSLVRTDGLSVTISATDPESGETIYYNPNSNQTLSKGMSLLFTAIPSSQHNHVEWEVKNKGDEARWKGEDQPRGGRVDENNFYLCKESTAYRGNHIMTCLLKNGSEVVARQDLKIRVR